MASNCFSIAANSSECNLLECIYVPTALHGVLLDGADSAKPRITGPECYGGTQTNDSHCGVVGGQLEELMGLSVNLPQRSDFLAPTDGLSFELAVDSMNVSILDNAVSRSTTVNAKIVTNNGQSSNLPAGGYTRLIGDFSYHNAISSPYWEDNKNSRESRSLGAYSFDDLCDDFPHDGANDCLTCGGRCLRGFYQHDKMNSYKTWKLYMRLVDIYENVKECTIIDFLASLKKNKIPIWYLEKWLNGSSFFPHLMKQTLDQDEIIFLRTHTLKNSLICDIEFPDGIPFGRKKKRPGGEDSVFMYVEREGNLWTSERLYRMEVESEDFKQRFILFALRGTLYALDTDFYHDDDVLDDILSLPDVTVDYEKNQVRKGAIENPPFIVFNSRVSCDYCLNPGHTAEFCFDWEMLNNDSMNTEKTFMKDPEITPKEAIKIILDEAGNENKYKRRPNDWHPDDRGKDDFVRKTPREAAFDAANGFANKHMTTKEILATVYGIEDLPYNHTIESGSYKGKTVDEILIMRDAPLDDETIAEFDKLMKDKPIRGKYDNNDLEEINKVRDELIHIIGKLPEIKNFKVPNFEGLATTTVLALLSTAVGLNFGPTIVISTCAYLVASVDKKNLPTNVLKSIKSFITEKMNLDSYLKEVQEWKYIRNHEKPKMDCRPIGDRGELKLSNPRMADFSVTAELKPRNMAGKLFIKLNKVCGKYGYKTKKNLGTKTVSLEIAAQSTSPMVISNTMSSNMARDRIERSARSVQGVNYDKDRILTEDDMVSNTVDFSTILTSKKRVNQRYLRKRRVCRGFRIGELKIAKCDKLPPPKERSKIILKEGIKEEHFKRPIISTQLLTYFPYKKFVPDPSHRKSLICGLRKRIMCTPPKHDIFKLKRLRDFNCMVMRELLKPIPRETDVTFETWTERTSYSGTRKAELAKKQAEIVDIWKLAYRRIDGFGKDEDTDDPKTLRAIFPRSDEMKCIIGPYTKAIEDVVYKLPNFIKHVPVALRPKYMHDLLYGENREYLESDYISFESLFGPEQMEAMEFPLYDYLLSELPRGPEIADLMRQTFGGSNVIKFEELTLYLEARRMSGEMTTSVANGWSNMIMMLFIMHENGVDWRSVDQVDEGDDGLTAIDSYRPTEQDFAELGFSIKLTYHKKLNTASFCGMIYDVDEEIVVRNPFNLLAGLFWTNRKYVSAGDKVLKQLYRSKALSLLYSYPGCPIIYSVAKWMTRVSEKFGEPLIESLGSNYVQDIFRLNQGYYEKNKEYFHKDVGMGTRNLMSEMYGVTIEHQIQIEKYFDNKMDYDSIDCSILESYMPDKFAKFFDVYTEECDVTNMDEIKCTVKKFPSNKNFKIWDGDEDTFLNPIALMKSKDERTKLWYKNCVEIQMDKNRPPIINEKEIVIECSSDDDEPRVEDINLDDDSYEYMKRNNVTWRGDDDDYLKKYHVLGTNAQGNLVANDVEINILGGGRNLHGLDDVDAEESLLHRLKYKMQNNYNVKQTGKLVDRLWTKVKVFGKKLRPGGCYLIKVFYETPSENNIGLLRGAEMQRNNRTMNSKRGKLSNRRNVNRNNVNLPKRKIKKQIRPRGNRAMSYTRAPSAIGTQLRTKNPKFIRSSDGSIRVVHREPLGTINGTIAFAVSEFSSNPGLATTFPWLSKIAQNFETYKFNKLNVEYITSVGANVGGSICIAPDYNSADTQPSNLQQMEQYMDAWRDVNWVNGTCRINPIGMGALGPMRYIRSGALATNLDIKTYDVCNIFVGTSGLTTDSNNTQIGELWVNYDVDLCIPNSFIANNGGLGNAYGYVSSVLGTGVSTTSAFGSASTAFGPLIVSSAGNVITITGATIGDNYQLSYSGEGTVSAVIQENTLVGMTQNYTQSSFTNNTSASLIGNYTATATTMGYTLNPNGTWAGITNMMFTVLQVSPV